MNTPFNGDDEGFLGADPLAGVVTAPTSQPLSPSTSSQAAAADDRGSVITARGTAEGLVLRIDGRVDYKDLLIACREFLESRRSFLSGHDVAFEWVGKKPEDMIVQELTAILSQDFQVSVRSSRMKTTTATRQAEADSLTEQAAPGLSVVGSARAVTASKGATPPPLSSDKTVSLFDGIEGFDSRSSGTNSMLWDDPDARIIYGTLRSGQKVETEHSIIVFGDVNSGAEVIAGGDIVILGTLRGIAHAGAYDESGGGRVIFSLNLQPTQLRIGLVISRGAGSERGSGERFDSTAKSVGAEVARVDNNMIVVEPYQSRTVWVRRRE
jgi:septum site-determining protein MinC